MSWIVVKKFPLETDLSAVTAYLRQRGVVHQIYEERGEQIIAVADSSFVEPLLQFLEGVMQGKINIESDNLQSIPQSSEPSLLNNINATYITSALIFLSAIGTVIVGFDKNLQWFTFQEFTHQSVIPLNTSLAAGEWWRLITPVFLHFGFFHVLFNCLWLWDLGRRVELLLGKGWYLFFFISTGILSNIAQYLWSGPSLFGGMSGFVYALVGFVMVSHKLAPHRLTAVPSGVIIFMLAWLVLCMTNVMDYLGIGIANAAHLGGLLSGCAFALVTTKFLKFARGS
ncbi:MAG: rhomboid family intramembrane serine protease [Pseudomonadota bacterium]